MIRGVHHIGIHTPDLDRLRSFYEQAFGFQVVGEEVNLKDLPIASIVVGVPDAAARVVMMKAPNCFLEIFQWSSPDGGRLSPLRAYDFGYTHMMIDVADIDAEYERLSKLGMSFVHPSAVHYGDSASIYGKDPDGNIIEIGEIPEGNRLHLTIAS